MTAYNKINGTFCSAHEFLIQDVLRKEWGWDGLVMSDWFGTNSVVPSVRAGYGNMVSSHGVLSITDREQA